MAVGKFSTELLTNFNIFFNFLTDFVYVATAQAVTNFLTAQAANTP
jgi:hypothetical protein